MDGYAAAFRDSAVQAAILSTAGGDLGQIAVNAFFFGSSVSYPSATHWVLLDSTQAINDWADALDGLARQGTGSTNLGAGMLDSLFSFSGNGFEGTRLVMDVSGDGADNVGDYSVSGVRNAAASDGVTINGLVILGETGLESYYNTNVKTSDGTVWVASDFTTFESSILSKIGVEVGVPVPEPATLSLLGLSLMGLGLARRRRRVAS